MRPADLRRVDVDGRVREELAVALAVDGARKEDARVPRRFGPDGRDVRVRVRGPPRRTSGAFPGTARYARTTASALFSGSKRET